MASNQNEQSVHQAQMSRICPIVMAHASSEAEGEKQLQRITYTRLRVNGGLQQRQLSSPQRLAQHPCDRTPWSSRSFVVVSSHPVSLASSVGAAWQWLGLAPLQYHQLGHAAAVGQQQGSNNSSVTALHACRATIVRHFREHFRHFIGASCSVSCGLDTMYSPAVFIS